MYSDVLSNNLSLLSLKRQPSREGRHALHCLFLSFSNSLALSISMVSPLAHHFPGRKFVVLLMFVLFPMIGAFQSNLIYLSTSHFSTIHLLFSTMVGAGTTFRVVLPTAMFAILAPVVVPVLFVFVLPVALASLLL